MLKHKKCRKVPNNGTFHESLTKQKDLYFFEIIKELFFQKFNLGITFFVAD
jgi:hypothetical protein